MSDSPSKIKIESYKHNGQIHRVWHENTVLKQTNQTVICMNDRTKVTESDGSHWMTEIPAIVCFYVNYWFNIVAMIKEDGVHYYCNLSSPYTLGDEAIQYIDYDLDVTVSPGKSIHLLDVEEYKDHKHKLNYSNELDGILNQHISYLYEWIKNERDPFTDDFVDYWYNQYLQGG